MQAGRGAEEGATTTREDTAPITSPKHTVVSGEALPSEHGWWPSRLCAATWASRALWRPPGSCWACCEPGAASSNSWSHTWQPSIPLASDGPLDQHRGRLLLRHRGDAGQHL